MSTLFKQPPDILKGKPSSSPADILGGKFSNSPPDLLRNTSGPVMSVFGRTGYVIAQQGDYTASLVTNAVDQTLSYANPAWITSLDYSKILNAPAIPSISAYQTPWLQNINAAGFSLLNAQYVGAQYFQVNSTPGTPGLMYFMNSGSMRWIWQMGNPETGGNSGSDLLLRAYNDAGNAVLATPITIVRATGHVTVGNGMDVTGDVNITGNYLINGVPISSGGNPAGATGQIQFNSAGAFGASTKLCWDITNSRLGVGNSAPAAPLDVSGAAKVQQSLTIYDPTSNGTALFISALAGNNASIVLQTASSGRWLITKGGSAESGSNAGSDFNISRYDDTGAYIGNALTILRSSGYIGINQGTPSRLLHIYGVSGAPSLTASTGEIALFDTTNTNALAIGSAAVSPYAVWIQGKRRANDGSSWPLSLNPVGGNVGIGTLTPAVPLDVIGAAKVQKNVTIYDPTSNPTAVIVQATGATSASVNLQTGTSTRWLLTKTATAEGGSNSGSDFNLIRYDDSGNSLGTPLSILRSSGYTGLGTAGPSRPLHIYGAAAAPSLSATAELVAVDTSQQILLAIGCSTAAPYPLWLQGKRRQNDGTSYPIVLNPLGGNIGIGLVNPRASLHVVSPNASDVGSISAAVGGLAVSNSSGNFGMSAGVLGGGQAWLQSGRFDGVSTGYSLMLQPAGGFVGINGVNPQYPLDVTGDINTSGVFRINGTPLATGGASDVTHTSGIVAPVAPPSTGWTWANQGASTVSTVDSGLLVQIPNTPVTLNWRLYHRPLPGATYTITAHMILTQLLENSNAMGLYLYDSTGGKITGIEVLSQSPATGVTLRVEKMTNFTTDTSTSASLNLYTVGTNGSHPPQGIFVSFRIVENGTNRTFYYSWDKGLSWIQFWQEATNTFLTPDKVAFGGVVITATSTWISTLALVSFTAV